MTRLLLLFIYFLFSCTALSAQQGADSITEIVTDSIRYSEATEYGENLTFPKETATPPPPVKYTDRKFNPGFKKGYSGDDFNYETKPEADNWATRLLAWIRKILRMLLGNSGSERHAEGSRVGDFLIKLMWVIVVLIAVYFIARAVLQKEGMWIFGRSAKKIVATDAEAVNIHEMDFASLIEKTTVEEDYRLALRYYYLWLLKKLSAREIITWNWEKTNTDYYYEIKDSALRDDFQYLSYVYDHSWYGDFKIDQWAFAKAEKAFKKTINTL